MQTRTLKVFMDIDENREKIEWYIKYARTMVWMYQCTKQKHYLLQAKECIDQAKTLKVGFMRPLGALVNEAA